ncbi:MAG: hypothetical protein Kow0098_25550 [Ignavibacteriaceae bacterium]
MEIKLNELNNSLKRFLTVILIVLSVGVATGLIYLYTTTSYTPEGAATRISGDQRTEEFGIPENFPRPVSELLITTHNHIIGLTLIFIFIGTLFSFNTIINGFWKNFFLIEPPLSVLTTFGSIWGIRFLSTYFAYIAFVSSVLIYTSYFIMVVILLFEINRQKNN